MDNAHVRHLLEPQQAALMEFHTVTTIGTNSYHCPDNQGNLEEKHIFKGYVDCSDLPTKIVLIRYFIWTSINASV